MKESEELKLTEGQIVGINAKSKLAKKRKLRSSDDLSVPVVNTAVHGEDGKISDIKEGKEIACRRCNKCGRPIKGHPLPNGSLCNLQPLPLIKEIQDEKHILQLEKGTTRAKTSIALEKAKKRWKSTAALEKARERGKSTAALEKARERRKSKAALE